MLFGFNKREDQQKECDLKTLGPFSQGGEEPKLKDMLSDPLIHMVARSDKLAPEELSGCVEEMRKKFFSRQTTAH